MENTNTDNYGKYSDLTIHGVTQRMRWIEPGNFLMGSLENEPWDDCGPQHEVRITKGYWLFDTPVTQELWTVVMGNNPSYFKDPKRPVENVSWDDAMRFIEKINTDIPGLDLVLPTEAQWEYACRAGTNTATYAGPMEILGENNAPVLDEIAWYGGNSGVDFELDNGWDSSFWEGKQYEHNSAGTHPVGLKLPNQWGLYDMLGNVWEWCADDLREYSAEAITDPAGLAYGAERALRGGSWVSDARHVRSAYRFARDHDDQDDDRGFRCARVRPEEAIEFSTEEELRAHSGIIAAQSLAHRTATDAGWYTNLETGEPVERNFGEVVALMHSELSEALEHHRKGTMDDKLPNRPGIEVEFADCILRILDTAAALDIDVAGALIEKNRYNQTRPDHKIEARRNGGKKY